MRDLWPDDLKYGGTVKPPSTILKEQATLLGKRTKNIVLAQVIRSDEQKTPYNPLVFLFYIVAPALGNYRYRLFTISHRVTSLYPVTIQVDDAIHPDVQESDAINMNKPLIAKSEDEFEQILEKIFASSRTRQIVNSLLALSDDTSEDIPVQHELTTA